MLASAVFGLLGAPTVFPTELDHRVLLHLPVVRRTVFVAKGSAFCVFASACIAVSIGTLAWPTLLILPTTVGHDGGVTMAAVAGSGFVILSLTALQGLFRSIAPIRRQSEWSAQVQPWLLGGVICVLPFALRASALWTVIGDPPAWVRALPPVWFWALGSWAQGDRTPEITQLAGIAVSGLGGALVTTMLGGLVAYRRLDPGVSGHRAGWRRINRPVDIGGEGPAAAVRTFVRLTLARSTLHQFVFRVGIAVGMALAANGILGSHGLRERWIVRAALDVPFSLMAGALVGLRLAFLLPAHHRAGWIFRLTERAEDRPSQLDAVRRILFERGMVLPITLALPVVLGYFDLSHVPSLGTIIVAVGWAAVEVATLDWRRIPFTCTFLFGKRPPALTVCAAVLVFGWGVFAATTLAVMTLQGALGWAAAMTVTAGTAWLVRKQRLESWGSAPFEFEDEVPRESDWLHLAELRLPQ